MRTFKLQFNIENAAFWDGDPEEEISRILGNLSVSIGDYLYLKDLMGQPNPIKDLNGNTIGSFFITDKEYHE